MIRIGQKVPRYSVVRLEAAEKVMRYAEVGKQIGRRSKVADDLGLSFSFFSFFFSAIGALGILPLYNQGCLSIS